MTKMGGLKSGIKQAETTRRLDDSISSSDFEKTRKKATRLTRQVRSIGEQLIYVLIGVTLFFCATRFALQQWFPGRVHQLLAPILGKNTNVVEQTLTGTTTPPAEEEDDAEPVKAKPKVDPKKTQVAKATTSKKTTKSKRRSRRRTRHHTQQKQS